MLRVRMRRHVLCLVSFVCFCMRIDNGVFCQLQHASKRNEQLDLSAPCQCYAAIRDSEVVQACGIENGPRTTDNAAAGRRARNLVDIGKIKSAERTRNGHSESPVPYSRTPRLNYLLAPAPTAVLLETETMCVHAAEKFVMIGIYATLRSMRRSRIAPNTYDGAPSSTTLAAINPRRLSALHRTAISVWGRSMQLAYFLAKLGFYYAPKGSQNKPLCDKIRCAFCKRGKMTWWTWPYRESQCAMMNRPSDREIVTALWKWHEISHQPVQQILILRLIRCRLSLPNSLK